MKEVKRDFYVMDKVTWSTHKDENVEHTNRINAKKNDRNELSLVGKKENEKKQIIDHQHPYWHAVYARLVPTVNEKGCSHRFGLVRPILESLPNIDVEETLDFYRINGGYCDCEVLYNVYRDEPELKVSGY